jgi:glycosyltransferase involved in cell wall biosynthesis
MFSDTYVIVPAYNEATVIGGVIKEISKLYKNVICVDDGSTDNTANEVQKSGALLISHPINLGAGAATQTGIEYALLDKNARYFITIDGDGQHNISDTKTMLEYLKKQDLDIVLGSRFIGKANNMKRTKKALLKIAAVFSLSISGVNLSDPHIGLRCFNRKFAEGLKITMPDFSHASELIGRIKEGNYKYGEVPVTVTYSDYSRSKGQPMLNAVNISFDLLLNKLTKK